MSSVSATHFVIISRKRIMSRSSIYSLMLLAMYLLLPSVVRGLECYACDEQDSNTDKCIKTVVQCEEQMEVCSTRVQWAVNPNWTPYGEYIYAIWKYCDTRSNCEAHKAAAVKTCKRDWYRQWNCYECCEGDMCNYYITLGGSTRAVDLVLVVSMAIATLVYTTRS